jgi:hypothetical protein
MERLVRGATRVIGAYETDRQVGFARIESDGEKFTFLLDVFVLPRHRGRGLGVELVREAVDRGPYAHLPWYLMTSDAHGLYARFGFGPPDPRRMMVRPAGKRARPTSTKPTGAPDDAEAAAERDRYGVGRDGLDVQAPSTDPELLPHPRLVSKTPGG